MTRGRKQRDGEQVLWFECTDRDEERQLRSGSGQQVPTLETRRSLLGTCWRMQLHREQGLVGHEIWELPSDQAREKMESGLKGRLQGLLQGALWPWPFLWPGLFTPAGSPSPRRPSLASSRSLLYTQVLDPIYTAIYSATQIATVFPGIPSTWEVM